MVEEDKTNEKKVEVKPVETEKKVDSKVEKKTETKEKKKEVKKVEVKPKTKAVVNGRSLRISLKQSVAIGKLIKGKTPDKAIERLEAVVKMKRAVPMRSSEVAHRKGKGMAGGRYPIKSCKEFIELLNQLKANAIVNEIENPVIVISMANKAVRPFKSYKHGTAGRRAKRTHVYIEAKSKKGAKK